METTGFDTRRFFEAVWELVREVPPGQVTTYGWLARRLGRPQNARLVGYALYGVLAGSGLPCHRVVNSQGRLSGAPHFGPPGQRARLEAEGVVFRPEGGIDLRLYLWRPPEPASDGWPVTDDDRSMSRVGGGEPYPTSTGQAG